MAEELFASINFDSVANLAFLGQTALFIGLYYALILIICVIYICCVIHQEAIVADFELFYTDIEEFINQLGRIIHIVARLRFFIVA
jgi:hypothetical protein